MGACAGSMRAVHWRCRVCTAFSRRRISVLRFRTSRYVCSRCRSSSLFTCDTAWGTTYAGYRPAGPGLTDGKNQTVMQFAPDGQLLMTLGRPGVAGNGPNEFNSPSDVLVAPNGDIFVADGHGNFPVPNTNDRIVKFSKDGKFIKAWGHHGSGQGEFDVTHGLAMDSAGR